MVERDLSDDGILARIDAVRTDLGGKIDGLTDDVHGIRSDMNRWRTEFVSSAVYLAHEQTRQLVHQQLEKQDEALGTEITDLKAEATRKSRERRQLWTGVVIALIGAIAAGIIAFTEQGHSQPIVVCMPTAGVSTCQ